MDKEEELRQAAKWAGFAAGTCESIRSLAAYRDDDPYSECKHPRAEYLNKSFAFLTRCYAELKDRIPALADELIGAVQTSERIDGLIQGCDCVPSWHHAVLAHTYAMLYDIIGDHIRNTPCDWGKEPPDLSCSCDADAIARPETVSVDWAGAAERLRQYGPLRAERLDTLCRQEATEAIRRVRMMPTLQPLAAPQLLGPVEDKPADTPGPMGDAGQEIEGAVLQYVTLSMMAAIVQRSPRTLEKWKARPKNPLPLPDIEGGGGKPDEWEWSRVRPWLQDESGRRLPVVFPSLRPALTEANRS